MKGGAKTVCTSHVLAWFGIDASSYHYSGTEAQRAGVLRKHGFAVRSRRSALFAPTMGKLRAAIRGHNGDPAGTVYMVWIHCGPRSTHLILVDSDGKTIVDTAQRKRDKRRIISVKAVFRK